jgi:hypothetical protein
MLATERARDQRAHADRPAAGDAQSLCGRTGTIFCTSNTLLNVNKMNSLVRDKFIALTARG